MLDQAKKELEGALEREKMQVCCCADLMCILRRSLVHMQGPEATPRCALHLDDHSCDRLTRQNPS